VRPPRHPYALDVPTFSFASLAALAARAPLGGVREVAIATFAAARLADDVRPDGLSAEDRQVRATAARRWLSTLSLAEPVRRAVTELIAATERDASATAAAVRRVIEVTGGLLDAASRSELDLLARELETQTVART
jgi:hypothetical protein